MGHMRLGNLPASRKWQEVVAMLKAGTISIPLFAEACANAAEDALRKAADDLTLQKVVEFLCHIPRVAKEKDLPAALLKLGIHVDKNPTITDVAMAITQSLDNYIRDNRILRTDLGEMSRYAMLACIQDCVPKAAATLWNATPQDIHHGLASFAAPEKFSDLCQTFYSHLTVRLLKYYVHRELPKHVSHDGAFKSVADLIMFDRALETHCVESSFIMRTFAKDWLGKTYSQGAEINRQKVKGFVYVASKKMSDEFRKRRRPDA
jgi:hypothetical protein